MMTDYQNQPVLIPLIFFTWLCKDHFYTVKKKIITHFKYNCNRHFFVQ